MSGIRSGECPACGARLVLLEGAWLHVDMMRWTCPELERQLHAIDEARRAAKDRSRRTVGRATWPRR